MEKTKIEIMKELGKSFDSFKNKQTGMHDLYELAYFCYIKGKEEKSK